MKAVQRPSFEMKAGGRPSFFSHFFLLRGVFLHLNWGDSDHTRCSNRAIRTIFDLRGSILALHAYFALTEKVDFRP